MSIISSLWAAINYPSPTRNKYVNDYAGVVDNRWSTQIINLGNELERRTGAEAVVVTVDTLKGMPIEDYANGLFRQWGIGQSQEDNGLLVLLVVKDKEWRVEVGRGLEGALPDVLTNRVMMGLGKPYFMKDDYGQGLAKIYSQFCDEIAEEYNITLTHSLHTVLPNNQNEPGRHRGSFIPYLCFLALFIFDLIFNRGRIFSFVMQMIFWNSFFGNNHRNGRGGNNGGGFGGGSSNGGGSSGSW